MALTRFWSNYNSLKVAIKKNQEKADSNSATLAHDHQLQAAYKMAIKKGTPQSKHAKIHDKTKLRKIDDLQEVSSSPEHSLDKIFLSS